MPSFSWHVRALHKPGKNGSKRKANGTDYAGIDQRVDEGGVGLRSEKDRPVVIKRKRAGRDKIALPQAGDDQGNNGGADDPNQQKGNPDGKRVFLDRLPNMPQRSLREMRNELPEGTFAIVSLEREKLQ